MINESFFKKYFKQGDYVQIDEQSGKLLNFSKNHLIIETDNGTPIFFSVEDPHRFSIENLSRPHRIQRLTLKLPLSISPQKAKEILEKSLQNLLHIQTQNQTYEIRLIDFSENKTVYQLVFQTTGEVPEKQIQDAVFSAVWYEFRRQGLDLETGESSTNLLITRRKDIDTVIQFMKKNELFGIFSDEDLKILAFHAKFHVLGVPECLGKEGETRDSLFLIESGTADILIQNPNKGFVKVAQIADNDIFGEMALLTGETRSASAEVSSEMTAYEISKAEILPVLRKKPQLIDELSRLLAKRQLENQRILNAEHTPIPETEIHSTTKKVHGLMSNIFS